MTPDVPRPIIAAQPIANTIRQALEECGNALDAAGARVASLTEPVSLPDGTVGVLRCSRDKHGLPRVTISVLGATTEAKK